MDALIARLEKLLQAGTVVAGGDVDHDARYVAPTIITDVDRGDQARAADFVGDLDFGQHRAIRA